jgi:hypothetical protein
LRDFRETPSRLQLPSMVPLRKDLCRVFRNFPDLLMCRYPSLRDSKVDKRHVVSLSNIQIFLLSVLVIYLLKSNNTDLFLNMFVAHSSNVPLIFPVAVPLSFPSPGAGTSSDSRFKAGLKSPFLLASHKYVLFTSYPTGFCCTSHVCLL